MRERYLQIIEEEKTKINAFKKDGWQYFQEMKPVIELGLSVLDEQARRVAAEEKKAPAKKVQKVAGEPKKKTPAKKKVVKARLRGVKWKSR